MRHFTKLCFSILIVLMISTGSYAQNANDAPLSKNAPTDRPHHINRADELQRYEAMIAPYVKKARKTLKKAKKKYKKGLQEGQAFFLTTRIYDQYGNFEQIFVRLKSWEGKTVSGTIANNLNSVKDYAFDQLIEFPETDILDWTITNPDGSEEGNYVGKFLDTLQFR